MIQHRELGRESGLSRRSSLARSAGRAMAGAVRAGAGSYDRRRDLPGLIRWDPFTGISANAAGSAEIVARLERALRAERNRARAGHWTYDLNRHIALRQAYMAERERLVALTRWRWAAAPTSSG